MKEVLEIESKKMTSSSVFISRIVHIMAPAGLHPKVHKSNVGVMLSKRLRRLLNLKAALVQCIVFGEIAIQP